MAKNLKTSQSNNIGILCEDISAFTSGDIIDGICDYAQMEASPDFQKSILSNLNQLLSNRICGLIYIGVYPRDVGNILPKLDIPVVYTYAYTTNDDYCVNYDDFQGAKLAVEYIIQKDHSKIAILSGTINSIPGHKRLLGYQTALMEHGIPFIPDYIRSGNWHYSDGYQQCQKLLELPDPPTAIFAMSDLMAYGAMNALNDRGLRVPSDISLHGFDNLEFSDYSKPGLSSINLPLREMGLKAAETIVGLVNNMPPQSHNILLNCNHVERDSVSNLL